MPVRKSNSIPTRFAAAALALLIGTGCGILSVDEPGDSAAVTISGTAPAGLRVILSNNFIQVYNQQTQELDVSLLGSDTVDLASLPYNTDYGLDGNIRFFMRVINPDSATANLRIQVRIDGVNPYDVTTNLTASQHEYTYAGGF